MSESDIVSIIIPKALFTYDEACQWVVDHGYNVIYHGKRPDITNHFYRFRQHSAKLFSRIRTKLLPNGIELLIGYY